MLDDFCQSTGYGRRYAARVLHQAGQRYLLGDCILVADPGKRIHRYRPPRYGPAVQQALITIWAASTFLGPVRQEAGMSLFVENLTRHGHLLIDEEIRSLLLQMSPATTPRLLAGERTKYRLHGISPTRSTPLGGRIPLQTCMDPPLDVPGALAVDLVGHDGGQEAVYDRHDTQEEVDLLNRLYKALHLLVNWFLPSQKLLHKVRTKSHITKVHDQAQTPCARMLARADVSKETKQQLQSTRAELDLASLEVPLSTPLTLGKHVRGYWKNILGGIGPTSSGAP